MEGYGALGAAAAADPLPLSSARPAAKRSGPLTAVAMALALLGVAAVALSSHGSGATVVPSAAALASEKRTGGNQSGSEVSDTSADDFTAGRDGNGRGGDMGDDFFDGGSRPSLDLTAAQLAAASAAVEAEATMVATGVPH